MSNTFLIFFHRWHFTNQGTKAQKYLKAEKYPHLDGTVSLIIPVLPIILSLILIRNCAFLQNLNFQTFHLQMLASLFLLFCIIPFLSKSAILYLSVVLNVFNIYLKTYLLLAYSCSFILLHVLFLLDL